MDAYSYYAYEELKLRRLTSRLSPADIEKLIDRIIVRVYAKHQ